MWQKTYGLLSIAKQYGTKVIFDIDYREYTWKNMDEISIYYSLFAREADIIIGSREEFNLFFKRIYEDGISGTISHDRFLKLSAEYEAEQRELEEKVKADQQEVGTCEQNKGDFDSFSAIIRKYVGIKELTPATVNEFIKKVIVYASEKVDGKQVQKVDIVFNFIGEINFLSVVQPKRQGA